MHTLQHRPIPRRSLPVIVAAIVLTAGTIIALGAGAEWPIPIQDGSGPWLNAVSAIDCNDQFPGTVCAEWPSLNTNTVTVCCVEPGLIGTYEFDETKPHENCHLVLGQRAL